MYTPDEDHTFISLSTPPVQNYTRDKMATNKHLPITQSPSLH